MCTVSIITVDQPVAGSSFSAGGGGAGFRIVCNRDENRRRPLAAAPKWRRIGTAPGSAIWPMDMEAGGTWIGAGEHGLSMVLLNLNPSPPVDLRGHGKLRSRGLVIPDLIGSPTPAAAMQQLAQLNLRHFAPFRLLTVAPGPTGPIISEARWDRHNLDILWHAAIPLCLVSSGLGDSLVSPRLDLFEDMVAAPGQTSERQDEFHRHTWPTRPEISVLMSRQDARTVSITTLDVLSGAEAGRSEVTMSYEPIADVVVPAHGGAVLARSMLQ